VDWPWQISKRQRFKAEIAKGYTMNDAEGAGIVLVVEDDAWLRSAAVDYLRGCGHTVCVAENADIAVGILEANEPPIDLIFTDINMPGSLDGLGLARLASARWPHVPVIVTSGATPEATAEFVAFFAKPYRIDVVASAIRAALRGLT